MVHQLPMIPFLSVLKDWVLFPRFHVRLFYFFNWIIKLTVLCWSQLKSHGRVLLSASSECGHKKSCKNFFAQSSNFLNAFSFKMERCIEIRAFCFFFSENTGFLYWLVHRAMVHHQILFDFRRFRPNRKLRIELKLQFQPLEFSQRRDIWLLQCLMLFCEFDNLELRKICWKGSTELLLLLFFTGARRRYPKSTLVILVLKLLLTAESWNCGRRHWYTLILISHSGKNVCPWRFVKRKKGCHRICSWKTRV